MCVTRQTERERYSLCSLKYYLNNGASEGITLLYYAIKEMNHSKCILLIFLGGETKKE
jgi:hypothetical protein